MIVVDASALIEVLLGSGALAERLAWERLSAPALLDVEVGMAARRGWLHGAVEEQTASRAVRDLAELEIDRYDHRALLPRAWELRHTVSFTDGLYVALAEHLDVPLLTLDARLAGAPGIRATVEVPGA